MSDLLPKEKIKALRKKFCFTNSELADYLDFPEDSVKSWSSGRHIPNCKSMMKIDFELDGKPVFNVKEKLGELKVLKNINDEDLAKLIGVGCQTMRQWRREDFEPSYDGYVKFRGVLELEGLV